MKLVNKGKRVKAILIMDGLLVLHRTMFIPADKESASKLLEIEGKSAVYPLDDLIGITGIPFKATEAAISKIVKAGITAVSYEKAAEKLNECNYYNISPSQVKRINDYVGKLVFAEDEQRAETAKAYEGRKIDRRKCKSDVLYIEFDGSFYSELNEDGPGCDWKECKIAIAFKKSDIREWANDSTEILKRDYVGYIGSADEFAHYLVALAVRNGLFETKEIVIITDGAKWILPLVKKLFPQATYILDMCHAKENAGKFAKAVKRGANQKKAYADLLTSLIDQGDTDGLLNVLSPYKDFKREGVVNFYKYVDRLKECMHYDVYKAKGYLVGSGHIESTHRYVMQNRMKCPGQHWSKTNAQGVLSIKCRYEGDRWFEVEELIRLDYVKCRTSMLGSF